MTARHNLLAEDETDIRELASEILRDAGYVIFEARNCDEAIIVFDAEHVDVLVTDVRMPGSRDGLDFAAYARQVIPTLPIVVVTGFAEQVGPRVTALGRRVTLLHKPFFMTKLLCTLAEMADEKVL